MNNSSACCTCFVDKISLHYICHCLSDLSNSRSFLGNQQNLTSAEFEVTLKKLVLQGKKKKKNPLIKVTRLKLFVQSSSAEVKAPLKTTYSRKCICII